MTGFDNGMNIFVKTFVLLAPSIYAASEMSCGIDARNVLHSIMFHMLIPGRMIAHTVSYRFKVFDTNMNVGIIPPEKYIGISRKNTITFLPIKLGRVNGKAISMQLVSMINNPAAT